MPVVVPVERALVEEEGRARGVAVDPVRRSGAEEELVGRGRTAIRTSRAATTDISVRSASGRTSNPGSRARSDQVRSRDPPRPEQAGGDRGHERCAEAEPRDVLRREVDPHERRGIDSRRGKVEHPLGHHGDHEPDEACAPDRHSTERPEPTCAPGREAHEYRRDERREVALLEMVDVLRDETARRHERDDRPGDRQGDERLDRGLLDLAPER